MKNFVKLFVSLTLIAVIPAAFAATSRVGVTGKASSRLPSIAGHLVSGTTTVTTTTSSTSAYYGDSECIEKYTDCIKGDDVCGYDMQECTTNVLFHGQMSKCLSVLYQCTSSGVNALFGTSAINALSNVATGGTNSEGEVTRYTYPTDGSVMGQLVLGAGISNTLTTEQCVRRYTNCLHRDDICGADFELCTDKRSFKKQALLCDSTLARCQSEAKGQLFGSTAAAKDLKPADDSRLGIMIDEGSALAAKNALTTCKKVVDNCLISACVKNPLRCVEGKKMSEIVAADSIADSNTAARESEEVADVIVSARDVQKLLKSACLETIGGNKYCHMVYREMPNVSDRDLGDIDLQEVVFDDAYADRKSAVNIKIQEELKKFDKTAKNKCVDTIKSCAMRSCGGGLGSVCYTKSKTAAGAEVHVNSLSSYNDILSGCSAIVNADVNCIYAAKSGDANGYTYTYYDDSVNNSAFAKLFPVYSNESADPIGAVATLNSLLATSYNPAAIDQMKKQCQTVALACVKSMCGKDYVNCYRNRTDIVSGVYDTGSARLDRSMNKMGGVLDYNIVIGMCMNTVKNSSVCEEHLKIAIADTWPDETSDTTSWGSARSVREAWLGAAQETKVTSYDNGTGIVVACAPAPAGTQSAAVIFSGDGTADCTGTMEPIVNAQGNTYCDDSVIDPDTMCVYNQPVYQSQTEYLLNNAGTSLFQTLLADVEKEVQAKYNAKLTKEQNICLANNNGGIMGRDDNGSTFMWVKLKNSKLPKNYETKGLTTKQFMASNDLYGSFCRARVTLLSDDKDIQDELTKQGGASTAYFAVGDSFTCGSWLSSATLQKISDKVGAREVCKQGYGKWENGECNVKGLSTKEKVTYAWSTVAPALAGGAIGLGLTESGLVSKLMTKGNEKNGISAETVTAMQKSCDESAGKALEAANKLNANGNNLATEIGAVNSYAITAYTACSKMGVTEGEGCKKYSITYSTDDSGNITYPTDSINAFKTNMGVLQNACANYTSTNENAKAIKAARVAIPIATTLAGGALGAGISASVIKSKKENIQNEAAQKWMDEIGEHIQCYLGTDELGSYGDVVSIELD